MKSENQVNGTAQNGVTIRNHRPGDMGFITYRHGAIYANEFDYGSSFEALVGRITSEFITTFDPTAERCWIAERDGQFLGCIILMKDRDTPGRAKLRCFLVEKSARGLGLGTQLMKLCIDFAREAGYERVGLRTDSNMVGARRMYAKTGFKILGTEEHRTWGLQLWDASPRAAFVALVSENQLEQMVASVGQLEHRFNSKYRYDWVFFSHEELSEKFKEATSNATGGTVTYNVIPKQHWSIPAWVDSGRFEAGLAHA
ncbi:hypothetical protein COL154_004408 [Colletotrichum chrysophilum]|nr:hypothetical protein COL154_004408 [Colletotrichum chrysophilum]